MNNELQELTPQERLRVYELILAGCTHIWSKNKLQPDRATQAFETLVPLIKNDPIFLAHLTSYAMTKTRNKDLQVFTTFVNALSSADGMPFSKGSKYKKPNLRYVSLAALHAMDPVKAEDVLELAQYRFGVADYLNEGRHFPSSLRSAFDKYLAYREANLGMLRGIKKAGMANIYKRLYYGTHRTMPIEVAKVMRWKLRGQKIEYEKGLLDFGGLTDLQIAEKIRNDKLPVMGVMGSLGAVGKQITPVIAVALLEQATGNQAVIFRKTFEDAGILTDPEVKVLFEEKIKTATTALDRVDHLAKTASEEVKKLMKDTRAEQRREQMGTVGKVFMHIDISGSLHTAIDGAIKVGAMVAELVNNPRENFAWGTFNNFATLLPLPAEFVEDAFAATLFGIRPTGGTDALALYPHARAFGADVDVIISDGGHNMAGYGNNANNITERIETFHRNNPDLPKPKAMVFIQVPGQEMSDVLIEGYQNAGIPATKLMPSAIMGTANVVEAVRGAMLGSVAIVDEIMSTELLKLPEYYFTL